MSNTDVIQTVNPMPPPANRMQQAPSRRPLPRLGAPRSPRLTNRAAGRRRTTRIFGSGFEIRSSISDQDQTKPTVKGWDSNFIIRQDNYIVCFFPVVINHGRKIGRLQRQDHQGGNPGGVQPEHDLAVVKVDASDYRWHRSATQAKVQVGDATVAVGIVGLSGTVTSGNVSALNRPVTAGGEGETSFINAIQTDAAINPGNSGGPLVNAEAQVIGVNSAIASLGSSQSGSQSGSIGLGFAIPSNTAKRVTEEIIATGTSKTPSSAPAQLQLSPIRPALPCSR